MNEDTATQQPEALPMIPDRIRLAVLAELDRLEPFIAALTAADWARPSAAQGWTVGDVVSHLNLAMALYARLVSGALAGKGSSGLWKTVGEVARNVAPVASPAFHAVNSAIPRIVDRTMSRDKVQSQFASAAKNLRERLDRVGQTDYNRPVYYVGGPWPLSFFLAAVVDELAIHGWDMASAVDTQARLDTEARAILPWFFWSGTPFMLRVPRDVSGIVQVLLTDPDMEMWWDVRSDAPKGSMGRAPNPDVTLRADSGTFVLALAGRISPLDALRFGAVQVEGNDALARTFLSSWHIL